MKLTKLLSMDKQPARILSLDNLIQRLGDVAPSAPAEEGKIDYEKSYHYAKSLISVAKQHSSLFAQEEMGLILASDFLMYASRSDIDYDMPLRLASIAPTAAALPPIDPKLDAALKVIAAIVKETSSYQDALRAGALTLESCIPYVGGIIAAITTIFWPVDKPSAWDQVKEQVKRSVQEAIFENEYNVIKANITAVQISLNSYANSPSTEEQATILIATMVLLNTLYQRVNQSDYRHMLIGLMVPIGTLHLAVLSERYNHYKVYFHEENRSEALAELKSTYDQYREFFHAAYPLWKDWRYHQFEVFYQVSHTHVIPDYFYGVKDNIGPYDFLYRIDDKARATDFLEWAFNGAIADMAHVLSSTQSYSTFLKDTGVELSPILSELDTIILGPYLWTRLQGTGDMNDTRIGDWTSDKPSGEVSQINIDAYNSIDGLQFIYPDMTGTKVSSGGGEQFQISLDGKQCIGTLMKWSSGLLYEIYFCFVDETQDRVYGNRGGWQVVAEVDARVAASYKLASGNFLKGSGPSGTTGINGVKFTFKRV